MKRILVLGAGKSSTVLINYLLTNAQQQDWEVAVGDVQIEAACTKLENFSRGSAFQFDVHNETDLNQRISKADLVISMIPARFHLLVANVCLELGKHLITPSYVTREMKVLDDATKNAGIAFLNEIGLDPGIDHMSAKRVIDELKQEGNKLVSFESFTGGLIAPESDDNPWGYKFTWNPRNVVLAGQGGGGVKFLQQGKYKYIPYHRLFSRKEKINIEGFGAFEGYANRDSLKYRKLYDLEDVKTMYRGTLRRPGFCKAWDILVQIGATDDSYEMDYTENMTHRDFINSFLKYRPHDSVPLKLAYYVKTDVDSREMEMLNWLGLFDETKIGLKKATPAQILQHILQKKWSMKPDDKDMIVMWHKFKYEAGETEHEIQSSLVVIGDNENETAMAKTVGLPIGIAAKLILNNRIKQRGVLIPVVNEIYEPILEELKEYGIRFLEKQVPVKQH